MKGFTLIELLIVIAILAVLATTVAVVLNPAQMLKEARDGQRMSDLKSIQSAVALYLASASSPSVSGTSYCTYDNGSTQDFDGTSCTINATTTVDGNGWVAINLSDTPSGSPLARLPLDPINDATYYYVYKGYATDLTFELNANMESTKYANGGSKDKESTDGGDNSAVYEIGSDPGLDLL